MIITIKAETKEIEFGMLETGKMFLFGNDVYIKQFASSYPSATLLVPSTGSFNPISFDTSNKVLPVKDFNLDIYI